MIGQHGAFLIAERLLAIENIEVELGHRRFSMKRVNASEGGALRQRCLVSEYAEG